MHFQVLTGIESCLSLSKPAAVFLFAVPTGYHTGVVYRGLDELGVCYLHMTPIDLSRSDPQKYPSVVVEPLLEEMKARMLAQICAYVSYKSAVPYSFDSSAARIETSGEVWVSGDSGFTCSSFVLALFQSAGIELINSASLVSSADAATLEHQDRLITLFRNIRLDSELIMRLSRTRGAPRIPAESVAGAAACPSLPVTLPEATRKAQDLISKLDEDEIGIALAKLVSASAPSE
jgi:hypothetical protein